MTRRPNCASCGGGAECRMGRDCPRNADTRFEMDSEVPPDASRTFSPPPDDGWEHDDVDPELRATVFRYLLVPCALAVISAFAMAARGCWGV